MRRHTVSTTVMLCATASLTAAMGTASAAPAASPAAGHTVKQQVGRPVLVDCLWHPQVHPQNFMIACGDGNSLLTSLHWSHWGATSATAQGFNVVNDCKPYCAAGKFHSYPVIVRLDHPQPWKKQPTLQHYTQMRLVYTSGRPDGFQRVVTYPLWN
ncbi:hypothetical protein AAW14_04340 [Streptomyces hygroscopicus]|uniref:hypothetical protein n=1 Tax=Streptomyces hygroscopicus TaxID=1912 RepID=UPI0022408B4E|nr:hypothetical protein [Streptomyces hygroscopicus]MCW7941300.1 hypothetical protein [Streptomyces hygroscopicus]